MKLDERTDGRKK